MGELTFFLGLQVKQKQDGIFISQDKYVAEILRMFGVTDGKSVSTPIDTGKPLLKDPDSEDVDVHTYSDYAGASLDKKSTTGGCQFLGYRLISWQCKKQTIVSTSSIEAEYVAAASCCAQVLWIQNQLLDYGLIITAASSKLLMFDASEGFEQIIDFLNVCVSQYALAVNPAICVSCIKQFWSSVLIKKTNDVVRLQALIDRRKVIITEDMVRQVLRLDDAESIDCLPNEEIFVALERMGYEKPSTKLTFYKAFFSAQWKFLIRTILHCMSAKRTAWNEFSSSMALAIICLATSRKFNFLKYIFDSLVRNVDSSSKFYMYPRFLQLMIDAQVALTQIFFANMIRVGKGFSGVDTLLFKVMLVPQQVNDDVADADVEPTPPPPTAATTQPTPQQELIPSPPQVAPTSPPSLHPSPIAQPSSPP
nr:copia protein [Tanacetum cinerariifolium]